MDKEKGTAGGTAITKLRLTARGQGEKTVLSQRYFTSPLKLGLPHGAGERLHVVLMLASTGMLEGDDFEYRIMCTAGAKVKITEQSYTKIFAMDKGQAVRRQKISVMDNASLWYLPSAVIPFQDSAYAGDMQVWLGKNSEFAYQEIVAAGRIAMGEKFLFRRYHSRISIMLQGRPVWLDNCLLEPQQAELEKLVFFAGYSHAGTFYFYGKPEKEKALLEKARQGAPHVWAGSSRALQGVAVRCLAHRAQDIEMFFAGLLQAISPCQS